MVIDLDPLYQHLAFLSPLSEARAGRLVGFLAEPPDGQVVDVGCGWGELLLRVVASSPHMQGIGLDTDAEAIAHARHEAAERGLADRATFIVTDAKSDAPRFATSAISIGASQAWRASDSNDRPMDYGLALRSLRAILSRGGRLVYGEGIWSAPPTAEAIAPLAGRIDEFVTLAELVEIAVSCDFMPIAFHEASLDEWDAFESGYSARYATWLARNPSDHPDASEVQNLARRQRAANLAGYRNILGMAYLELVAT